MAGPEYRPVKNHRRAGWFRSFHGKGLRLSCRATIRRSPCSLRRVSFLFAHPPMFLRALETDHTLSTTFGLRCTQMESPVHPPISPGFPRSSCRRICQMFFERFNVAGLSILERPMTQVHSCRGFPVRVQDIGEQAKLKETGVPDPVTPKLKFCNPLFDSRVLMYVPLWRRHTTKRRRNRIWC